MAAEERRNEAADGPVATGVHLPGYSGGRTPEREGDGDGDGGAGGRGLGYAGGVLVPRLAATTDEITNTLRALDGRYVPAGPSGAPTRGMAHVLPTGRNFYAVDARALPSMAAWQGRPELAREVLDR